VNNITDKFPVLTFIGPTNAGKSTLLNKIFKKKISIVSNKVQTTNFNLSALKHYNGKDIKIIDTPGLYYKNKNPNILNNIKEAIDLSDLIIVIIDISIPNYYEEIVKKLILKKKQKKILVINKIDKVEKTVVYKKVLELKFKSIFDDIFYISAIKDIGVSYFLDAILKNFNNLKEKKKNFQFIKNKTNISKDLFISELTREAIFKYINKEIPYKTEIKTNIVQNFSNHLIIKQTILVNSENHKKIVIGKDAKKIKQISMYSKNQIAKLFKKKISLFINVEQSK